MNLHKIFCYLVDDDNFLSTIIELDDKKLEERHNKNKGFNLMANMISEYVPLTPYKAQNYTMFPQYVKKYLTPDYARYGIKNITEKNLTSVNISFLNSLNMLIRPEIYKFSIEEHMKNLNLLENYVTLCIQQNYGIDKIKNTKKMQSINRELVKNLLEGKISHDLIQYMVNIFEINLLVFDLTKMDIYLYWTKGYKYPFFNPFKNIHCMSYVQGNYEPIMPTNILSGENKIKMYVRILSNISEIKCVPEINLALHTMLYIGTWEMDVDSFIKICEIFRKKKTSMGKDILHKLFKMESE